MLMDLVNVKHEGSGSLPKDPPFGRLPKPKGGYP
jgi:hypothetical protein